MFKYLRSLLFDVSQRGIKPYHDDEIQLNITIVNLFTLVGMSITAVLGSSAGYHGQYLLMTVLFITSLIYYIAYRRQRVSVRAHRRSAFFVVVSLNVLILFLIFSGGVENTGPLWMYLVPAVALFLGGLAKGLINIGLFLFFFCILMFYNGGELLATNYPLAYKLRLLYSFLSVTFLCYCYEYSRQVSFNRLRQLKIRFEEQAKMDPLTSLSNRRDMMEILQKEHARIQRQHGSAALLLCDVDYFKKVNDTLGHESGDKLLQQLSAKFKSLIRKQDNVARWGGEEFLFFLPDTSFKDAMNLAEKIRKNIEQAHFDLKGLNHQITICIGVAELTSNTPIAEVVANADKQLYEAKGSGRNTVRGLG